MLTIERMLTAYMKTEPTYPQTEARPTPSGSSVTGKVVVLGVFAVAIAAATFALWWNISRSKWSLAFWGPESVRLIQQGKQVELLVLEPRTDEELAGKNGEFLQFGKRTWEVTRNVDLSQARGLVHARHALTDDASYAFDMKHTEESANWSHAVRFGDDQGSMLILMDFPSRRFANYEAGKEVTVIPKIADGWKTFVERHN